MKKLNIKKLKLGLFCNLIISHLMINSMQDSSSDSSVIKLNQDEVDEIKKLYNGKWMFDKHNKTLENYIQNISTNEKKDNIYKNVFGFLSSKDIELLYSNLKFNGKQIFKGEFELINDLNNLPFFTEKIKKFQEIIEDENLSLQTQITQFKNPQNIISKREKFFMILSGVLFVISLSMTIFIFLKEKNRKKKHEENELINFGL
jgi:hypothetical protein